MLTFSASVSPDDDDDDNHDDAFDIYFHLENDNNVVAFTNMTLQFVKYYIPPFMLLLLFKILIW